MARMINNTRKLNYGVRIITVFEDGHEVARNYKIGDTIENLRYVLNGDIEIITGKLRSLSYSLKDPVTFNPGDPKDTLVEDMKLVNVTLDMSQKFDSKVVSVPAREIVEFDGETPVKRMKIEPYLILDMELKYSDYSVSKASVEKDDTFNNVRIINPTDIGNDITGTFVIIGFAYKGPGTINVYGLVLKNVDTDELMVVDIEHILALNEIYHYEIPDSDAIAEVIAELKPGDTVQITGEVDTSNGKRILIDKENISIVADKDITSDGSSTSGIRVTTGGSLTLSGNGKVVTEYPYDRNHSNGVIAVDGGELTFNGSGIDAVIDDDPVNKGQFGVCLYGESKLTVNAGNFKAGWYCISGNGSTTSPNSVETINGGLFESTTDYTIYHPHAGKLVINGGKFIGAAGALAANAGNIEINGGEFIVTGNGNTGDWADGTSGLGDVAINLNARYGDITCRIMGGVFRAASSAILIATGSAHTVDLKISGGKFSTKPNPEWIAEGYTCNDVVDTEGLYEVTPVLQG